MNRTTDETHVIKLGGSLLDLPDLVSRFESWRKSELGARAAVVVGGGDAADAVRAFDARFLIGEDKSHWLAMRGMLFNAHLVAAVVQRAAIVSNPQECEAVWSAGQLAIVDAVAWLANEESDRLPGGVPHRWSFTSDSIAAHLAARLGAKKLTLLKSTLPAQHEGQIDAKMAGEKGVVDVDFSDTIRGATVGEIAAQPVCQVRLVNLRSEPWTWCSVH